LNAVPKFSANLSVVIDVFVCVEHWFWVDEPLTLAVRPLVTKPTYGVAFEINSEVAPLMEIEA
jgi:hypothetical protein